MWPSRLASLMRNLFRGKQVERDLDGELRAYFDQLTDRNLESGLPEAEARRRAHMELGGLEQLKEEVREGRSGHLVEEFLQNLRYGVRTLRRDPGFTFIAVLALALGIGANTAMFSVAYGILARPLPYPDASRVAVVCMRYYPRDFALGTMCLRDFETWQANNRVFEQPALFSNSRADIGGADNSPEQVQSAIVTSGFFPALRASALLGRAFAADEDRAAGPSLAVLSESLWRRRFGASRKVLGQSILIGGMPYSVIGVMPNSVRFPRPDTEVWTNLKLVPPSRYGPYFYRGLARLKPGFTLEQAQVETNAIGRRMMQQNPVYQRLTLPVVGLRQWMVGDARKAVLVLIGAVGMMLLVALVNVANLLLARSTVRQREMALRLSLGAGRGRLVRQLLTESILLGLAGGAAGAAFAYGALELLRSWNPGSLPLMDFVRLDWRALFFAMAVALAAGVIFGMVPAFQSSRTELNSNLKEGGRGGTGSGRARVRGVLVVAEIALSLALLVGAGLLLRSYGRLQGVSGGFSAPGARILTMTISPGDRKFQDPKAGVPLYREILRRAGNIPGVESASISDALPPDRQGDADTFGIDGQTLPAGQINPVVSDITASTDYFRTLQIPLRRGRYFDEHDTADSQPVTIISESMARRFFPGRDPIGLRIRQSGPENGAPWMTIVGIVGDVKYLGRKQDRDSDAAYYMPLGQSYTARMSLAVRTAEGRGDIASELRREIQSANPLATVSQTGTMAQALSADVAAPRFDAALLSLFAGTALLMASVGIYGLIAFSVARRTQEIGVRMALGARRADVLRMVIRQAMVLACYGIALGVAGSLALTRFLNSLLFGTSATDPVTFTLVPLVLTAIVLLAAAIPARRATRISPVVALRYE